MFRQGCWRPSDRRGRYYSGCAKAADMSACAASTTWQMSRSGQTTPAFVSKIGHMADVVGKAKADACAMTYLSTHPDQTTSPDVARALRLIDASNRRDIETAAALLAPDYQAQWPDATLDLGGAFERELTMMTGIPDTAFVVEKASTLSDGRVLLECTVSGTHDGPLALPHGVLLAATGRPVALRFDFLMTFVDGLLVHERLMFDHHELIQQLNPAR